MPVSLLGQLLRLLAQLPLAADSGVLHVLLGGVTQASFSKPPSNTSQQFPPAAHHDKEHQGAASAPWSACTSHMPHAASEVDDF